MPVTKGAATFSFFCFLANHKKINSEYMITAITSAGVTYNYPVQIIADEKDFHVVHIGGTNDMHACMTFLVFPISKTCTIQNFMHAEHCSTNRQLKRGSEGMKVLAKAGLKFIMKTYPDLRRIRLTDESIYENIWLPEIKMLTEGQTWYQKYLGAEPAEGTAEVLEQYKNIRKKYIFKESLRYYTKDKLSKLLKKLYLEQLTGKDWYISRKTIKDYDISIKVTQTGGSESSKKEAADAKKYYRFRLRESIHSM